VSIRRDVQDYLRYNPGVANMVYLFLYLGILFGLMSILVALVSL